MFFSIPSLPLIQKRKTEKTRNFADLSERKRYITTVIATRATPCCGKENRKTGWLRRVSLHGLGSVESEC